MLAKDGEKVACRGYYVVYSQQDLPTLGVLIYKTPRRLIKDKIHDDDW